MAVQGCKTYAHIHDHVKAPLHTRKPLQKILQTLSTTFNYDITITSLLTTYIVTVATIDCGFKFSNILIKLTHSYIAVKLVSMAL